jgi:hypothetical protein
MSFRKGIVVEVHPEDHSVDLVMADDGTRLVGVQVITPNGSTRTGTVDLPAIPKRANKWDVSQPTGQDMHAIVGYVGRNPVVTGFIFPQVNQMLSKDGQLRLMRHQSDVMTTIDGDGNIQLAHPSGLFLRIGADPELQDFTGKNADANSKADRNTGTTPYVRLAMAGGKAVLTIAPDGAVSLTTETTVDVQAKGNVAVTTQADALVQAAGTATVKALAITLDGDTTVTKSLTVEGVLTYQGGMQGSGGSGATAVLNGNLQVTGNVAAGGSVTDGDGDGGA